MIEFCNDLGLKVYTANFMFFWLKKQDLSIAEHGEGINQAVRKVLIEDGSIFVAMDNYILAYTAPSLEDIAIAKSNSQEEDLLISLFQLHFVLSNV